MPGLNLSLGLGLGSVGGGAIPFDYYVNALAAGGGDGSEELPFDTWANARALLAADDRVSLDGTFDELIDATVANNEVVGQSVVIDVRKSITTWTADPTETDVWFADVTHDYDIVPAASLFAGSPHFTVWDLRGGEAYGTPLLAWFGNARANLPGSGTIADYRAYVAANPGTFTCHFQGSSASDPRIDTATGTTRLVRYYIHLADSSDPNAAGTEIKVADAHQERPLTMGQGAKVRGLTIIGAMWRTVNDIGSATRPASLQNHVSLDTSGHGAVIDADVITNFRAKGHGRAPIDFVHAGLNLFRSTIALGTGPAITINGLDVENYGRGLYWHGNGPPDDVGVHQSVHLRGDVRFAGCHDAIFPGTVVSFGLYEGTQANPMDIIDCSGLIWGDGKNTVRWAAYRTTAALLDGSLLDRAWAVKPADATGPTIEDTTFDFNNAGDKFLWINPVNDGTKGVTFRRCEDLNLNAVGGNALSGIGAQYRDVNVTLEDCIFGDLMTGFTEFPFNTLTATGSTFGLGGRSREYLAAIGITIDVSNTLTGVNTSQPNPTITSATTGNVDEGNAFAVTLTADQTVAWEITGGTDAASFSINATTGELSIAAQTYVPAGDNDRDVQIRVTNFGGNTTTFTFTLNVVETLPELVTNGTFDTDLTGSTDASTTNSSTSHDTGGDGGRLALVKGTTGAPIRRWTVATTIGETYTLSVDVSGVAAQCRVGSTAGNLDIFSASISNTSYSNSFTATSNPTHIQMAHIGAASTTIYVDNLSVK